jgi:hypothetical protein
MPKASAKSNLQLPSGFKAIEHLGAFWSGKNPGDQITGKMLSRTTKKFPKTAKYPARTANVYTLDVKGQKIEVTQSGGLGALEEVKKGETVCILYLGLKKLAGKQAMREYVVGIK